VKTAAPHANPTHLSAAEACGVAVSNTQIQLRNAVETRQRPSFGNDYEGEKYDENEPIGVEIKRLQ
jgi:hypothetical protein